MKNGPCYCAGFVLGGFMRSDVNLRTVSGVLVVALSFWSVSAEAKDGFKVLYNFNGTPDASHPFGALLRTGDGSLNGTTFGGGTVSEGAVFRLASDGTESVLHSFTGGATDGAEPLAELIADEAGNLYGTTQVGGSKDDGAVFKITPSGTESVLHFFTDKPDGATLAAGLLLGKDGNLYGGTVVGGKSQLGTLFQMSVGGATTILHSFNGNDGVGPSRSLISDKAGNLYGTTDTFGDFGHGTIFKLTTTGKLRTLYAFSGGSDGGEPESSLVRDKDGNLYGTTQARGIANCNYGWGGCGVVFKLAPDGTETTLYSFTGGDDGGQPSAGLIIDAAGNLYGTTEFGGSANCTHGCGVVFRIAPDSTEITLHAFSGQDGSSPVARLTADGKKTFKHLYGVTSDGGSSGHGTIFEIKLKS
jgi:uncharacterized repeat protein (TIGR03803 family)